MPLLSSARGPATWFDVFVKRISVHSSIALVIFGVALAFRLAMLGVYQPTSPWVAALTLADAEMGRNLVEGRGWMANAQLLDRATKAQVEQTSMVDLQTLLPVNDQDPANIVSIGMAHSPGYSLWFAASYLLGGDYRYVYSQRMQAVLDAISALLVFAIGRRCWSLGAGVVGGLLYAVSPPHAFLGNLTVAAATDSFWFLLAAYGAVVTAQAVQAGRRPWVGAALVAAAGFFGACMNSTSLVLPTVTAGLALILAVLDRRLLRVAAVLVLAQVIVLAALMPWAARNQRQFDQFTLVRGSFWQLAFAAWGELPNPWGLGFDDKEYWHWVDENCPACSPGTQQKSMRDFLVAEVVTTRPFKRHIANLLALRLPRALDVARTPEGVFRADAPEQTAQVLRTVFDRWDRTLPFMALLAAAGLVAALLRPQRRLVVALGLAPTLFLTCFSLVFYVELRKTVPGYGFVFVLVGIAVVSLFGAARNLARRLGQPSPAAAITAMLFLAAWAGLQSQAPVTVAAGELHSAIVNSSGEVWGWGNDLYGQLGNGKQLGRYAADPKTQAARLGDVVEVAAGSNHTLAIRKDGSVWAWGDNSLGQLGDGTRTTRLEPVPVPGLGDIQAVAGGYVHSVALDRRGVAWTWGSNLYGQLGVAGPSESLRPLRVDVPRPIVAVAAGWFFSLAVDDTGQVWAWGRNSRGQLGSGSTIDSSQPALISALSGIRSVAAGHQHAIALGRDGRVWGWGANDYGQVGVPRADHMLLPRAYSMLETIAQNAARKQEAHNEQPSIVGRTELAPQAVPGVPPPARLLAAADSSLAMTKAGAVWAWGDNLYGQLGDATYVTRATPAPVRGLPPVEAIGAGHAHLAALATDSTLWTWGFGHYGQLGDGLTERRLPVPRKVLNLRAREPVLDLSAANALVFGPSEVGWVEPGVVAEGHRLIIKNTAAGPYTYAALAKPVTVGPEARLRHLFVQGVVRSGAITVGVQENERWVFQTNVETPGPFTVFWEAPATMDAVVVIAHYLPLDNLTSDVEIASWGWLKAVPSLASRD